IYNQSNICWDLVEARILNFFITTLYVKNPTLHNEETEIDVGEIYYNNDGIFKEQLIYAAFNHTSERESKLNRMLEFIMMQQRNPSQKKSDNKRKGSTQCSILENVFLYLIIDLYFIFFIILGFAFSFPCFIFTFVKFSVVSVSSCLVLNGFSFSFMNSLLTISEQFTVRGCKSEDSI
uniref:Uncharacterized protein n=1 Tax=Strongyloides stercoralis TaxID=6248 RepID=A0AAF5DEV4_STRER